ncbi:MBL fold metallo-hydrolase [Cryptosporangium phraense]|uniref:MBL fold metallo-hydrolase n=1 Tax=Cryptosporangium phraense TaxID=2593070 RepID=A0A545ANV9_9ACTN|nr:MBL fold metallo-hydrolase [Cryptosporangium phraense]TQS42997.1 MBL fold metallo-hydrolase [Cryptosporangium phraense]
MLTQIADGVLVHRSEFCQSNAVVVQGRSGVLLIDAGVQEHELACLAEDLAGQAVVAGFSTHPHWDHLLWHPAFGDAPRYGTVRCADTARARLSDAGARDRVRGMIPADIVDQVPLELLGGISGLAASEIPWDGPTVRVVEHQAHAPGHASLVVEDSGVLVAGDLLSDLLIPLLDLTGAADPAEDYLAALRLLEGLPADVVVPGHGSVARGGEIAARLDRDRAYVQALADEKPVDDPRVASLAPVHERQVRALTAPR